MPFKFYVNFSWVNSFGVHINTILTSQIDNIKSLFAQTPEMFCITSGPEHVFEFVNQAHIKALGFDATGKAVRVAQPESVEVHGILDDVFRTGVTASLHEIAVTLGDSLRYFDLTYAAKRDSSGVIDGIMILGAEVTNRVLVDQKIENERKRLFNFFEQLPAAVAVLTGPDYVFQLANNHYKNIFNKEREIVGKPLYEAIPDLPLEFKKLLDEVKITGKAFYAYEYPIEIVWDKGVVELRYFNFFYEAYLNIHNEVEGVIAFVYDITGQVVAKEKVEKALKARDEFLSIASHELKTPLTSISLQLQSAQRRLERGQTEEYTIDKLAGVFLKYKKQNDRLVRLVNDMLDISRMNLGKLSYEFKRADLMSIVETSFENIKEQFDEKKSELKIIGVKKSVPGSFDKQRMEQVLTNLLTNALKYGEGKPVTIELVVKDKSAQIKVVDSGPGVPRENFDKIFQKFERVAATFDISGLGIGLFIAKEIVEAHQGKIWVESENGSGSTFIVELPVE